MIFHIVLHDKGQYYFSSTIMVRMKSNRELLESKVALWLSLCVNNEKTCMLEGTGSSLSSQ